MAACWQEVLLKGARQQPFVKPGRVVWLDPQTIAAVLNEFQTGNTDNDVWRDLIGQSTDSGLWHSLRRARDSQHEACTVLLPVHSLAPQHWTLLVLCRPASSKECRPAAFSVQYFDSLTQPSQAALEQATASLRMLAMLIQPAQLMAQPAELKVAASRKQSDRWSCGFWVLLWCEQYYRLARGEAPKLCQPHWTERRHVHNNVLQSLLAFKHKKLKSGLRQTARGPHCDITARGLRVRDSPRAQMQRAAFEQRYGQRAEVWACPDYTMPDCSRRYSVFGCARCRYSQ
jgi:hypothetical protein